MKIITIVMAISIYFLGCAHSSSTVPIQHKISEFDNVESFVAWLNVQPNITDAKVNKHVFLTSLPPRVAVTYFQDGVRHKLLLQVEPERKLKLVKPE